MNGPSDFYGDMSLEDVDEFEGLQPDNEAPIDPYSRFDRSEVRNFNQDFEWELDQAIWEQDEPEVEGLQELDDFVREAE